MNIEIPCRRMPTFGPSCLYCKMPAPNEPDRKLLHGVTLERMLNELVEHVGWKRMGRRVRIACFNSDPSISSSLRFLRRTPWARAKVEEMYLESKARHLKHQARDAERSERDADHNRTDNSNSDGNSEGNSNSSLRVSDTPTE